MQETAHDLLDTQLSFGVEEVFFVRFPYILRRSAKHSGSERGGVRSLLGSFRLGVIVSDQLVVHVSPH